MLASSSGSFWGSDEDADDAEDASEEDDTDEEDDSEDSDVSFRSFFVLVVVLVVGLERFLRPWVLKPLPALLNAQRAAPSASSAASSL